MKVGRASRTRLAIGAALALSWICARPAAAQPDAASCAQSFEDAQTRRRDAKLKDARAAAIACAQEACGKAVRAQCASWLDEIAPLVPSIVVAAKDATGADIADARVLLDGVVVALRLDGKAIELDPGEHEVRVEPAYGAALVQKVVTVQGQQSRIVTLEAPKAPAPPSPPPPSPPPAPPPEPSHGGAAAVTPIAPPASSGLGVSPLVPAGFAIGGASLLAGAVLGGVVLAEKAVCAPNLCGQAKIDQLFAMADASTATLAIGGAGVLLGLIGLALPPDDAAQQAFMPLAGPGFAGIAGRF